MATGLLRIARREVLPILKADAPLVALVPAASIWGQTTPQNPSWPFIKFGAAFIAERIRAPHSANGALVAFSIHAFARDRQSAGVVVETAEDHCGRIGAAIEAALADQRISITGGGTLGLELSDAQLMADEEPEAFHYFAQANCRIIAA